MIINRWFCAWPIDRRVVVNLLDGRAFDGLLVDRRGDLLVLGRASLMEPGNSTPVPIDGLVYVERPHVAFLQVP